MDAYERQHELHEQYMALGRERDLIEAKRHDLMAEHDTLGGNLSGAEWHRAQAKALRTRDESDMAEAHRLWIVSMAHSHLRRGDVPEPGSLAASEVEAEMDRLREQTAQSPAPDLDRCAKCAEGILDSRLGGMCGDWQCGSCPREQTAQH